MLISTITSWLFCISSLNTIVVKFFALGKSSSQKPIHLHADKDKPAFHAMLVDL
jgi:hypothetical protein